MTDMRAADMEVAYMLLNMEDGSEREPDESARPRQLVNIPGYQGYTVMNSQLSQLAAIQRHTAHTLLSTIFS